MADYTRGVVRHYDDTETRFAAGYSDQVKAARACGVSAADMESNNFPLDYPAQLAYAAIRREGGLVNVGYEAFLDTIAQLDLDDDPESEGPPAS